MKTLNLIFAFIISAFLAHAQQANQHQQLPSKETIFLLQGASNQHLQGLPFKSAGQVIWSEDFSGGIPALWNNHLVSGPNGFYHSVQGSQGQFGNPNNIIMSSTPANGFLMIDPDGANSPKPAVNYHDVFAEITTSAIDLSNHPGVNLEFVHYFRAFDDAKLEVGISNDGQNFTYYDLRRNLPSNVSSQNPISEKIAISEIAGNQSTVYIRFKWSRGSSYFWMIDDLKITEADEFDLAIKSPFFSNFTDTSSHEFYYTEIPHKQANFDSLYASAKVANLGYKPLQNLQLKVQLTGPQVTQTAYSRAVNYASNSDTTLQIETPLLLNQGEGNYQIKWQAISDSAETNTNNNIIQQQISVSDTIYARDLNNPLFLAEREPEEVLASRFDFFVSDTVTSLSLFIGNTASGQSSIGAVYKMFIYGPNSFNIIAESEFLTVTRTGWVNVDVPDTKLDPGTYLVGVEVIENSLFLAIDQNRQPKPHTIYENLEGTIGTGGLNGNWYYNNFIAGMPYLRMHTKAFHCKPMQTVANIASADCGQSNGQIVLNTTTTQSPVNYQWQDFSQQQNMVSNLSSGTYTVSITDADNCLNVEMFSVSDLQGPAIAQSQIQNNTCANDNSGSIALTMMNATINNQFNWSNGLQQQNIQQLEGGFYTVTITDSNNLQCKTVATFKIQEPEVLEPQISTANAVCNGESSGRVLLNIKGGVKPYQILWNTGDTETQLNQLQAGNYSVTVTDANQCTQTASANVGQPTAIRIVGGIVDDFAEKGNIKNIAVVGGQSPYVYTWSGPNSYYSSTLDALNIFKQGEYILKVTDFIGCSTEKSFNVGGGVFTEEFNDHAQILVYPQPAKNMLYINSHVPLNNNNVTLFNVLGKQMAIELTNNAIDVSDFQSGIYYLKIETENLQKTIPVVVN